MVLDPRKRQKKLERKKAKDKKRAVAERANNDVVARFERAAAAPILHSCVQSTVWNQGMGMVLLSRELASGGVAFGLFLLDVYCLGVKDVIYGTSSRADYDSRIYRKTSETGEYVEVSPEHARKLVEQSVEYAGSLGFRPPSDYQHAKLIFGEIDAAACNEEFEFGQNGKPYFIAGPNDSPARCELILATLQARLGSGGHTFAIPLRAGSQTVGVLDSDVIRLT